MREKSLSVFNVTKTIKSIAASGIHNIDMAVLTVSEVIKLIHSIPA